MPKKENKNNEDKNFAHAVISWESEFKKTLVQNIEKSTFIKKRLLHF